VTSDTPGDKAKPPCAPGWPYRLRISQTFS
jgi:hypothetical protein